MTDLATLQSDIATERTSRGFTTDPLRLLTLLTEEMGEIARELKKTWSPNYEAFDVDRLALEFGVDLESSVRGKFFGTDADRSWRSARPS